MKKYEISSFKLVNSQQEIAFNGPTECLLSNKIKI